MSEYVCVNTQELVREHERERERGEKERVIECVCIHCFGIRVLLPS